MVDEVSIVAEDNRECMHIVLEGYHIHECLHDLFFMLTWWTLYLLERLLEPLLHLFPEDEACCM